MENISKVGVTITGSPILYRQFFTTISGATLSTPAVQLGAGLTMTVPGEYLILAKFKIQGPAGTSGLYNANIFLNGVSVYSANGSMPLGVDDSRTIFDILTIVNGDIIGIGAGDNSAGGDCNYNGTQEFVAIKIA